ncbi:hypothetical protein IJD15_01585 [bacterium]|nr:hypothetical protein [bacterium]
MNIKLYDKINISELILNADDNQKMVLNYLEPIICNGINSFISNINCETKILKVDNFLIPIVIADKNYDDSLYVSLLSHYIKYIKLELKGMFSSPIERIVNCLFSLLEKYLISNDINKVVYVNNWYISTNLYPNLTPEQVKKITDFIKKEYPDYLVALRSINKYYDEALYNNLKENNYKFIINRQTFIFDKKIENSMRARYRWKLKKDRDIYNKSDYNFFKATNDDDCNKVEDLYTQLYIKKYSIYNPLYSSEFFKLVQKSALFDLNLLKKDNQICGICLNFCCENKITAPAVGYEMKRGQHYGLYRMIMSFLMNKYKNYHEIYNMSAGVGEFKMQRGAVPAFEYIAINYAHLSINRKIVYKLLECFANFSIPILCKYKICGFVNNKL